jgi:hypothetical protein
MAKEWWAEAGTTYIATTMPASAANFIGRLQVYLLWFSREPAIVQYFMACRGSKAGAERGGRIFQTQTIQRHGPTDRSHHLLFAGIA